MKRRVGKHLRAAIGLSLCSSCGQLDLLLGSSIGGEKKLRGGSRWEPLEVLTGELGASVKN